ncbi:MAG: hypothetical protein JWQ10_3330 [Herbaspirillum sp.]|jgi:hypothetical protein|nr:hypothetical protein [Herbaspirillum sp.]
MKLHLFLLYYGFYRRYGKSIWRSLRLARYRTSDWYY